MEEMVRQAMLVMAEQVVLAAKALVVMEQYIILTA